MGPGHYPAHGTLGHQIEGALGAAAVGGGAHALVAESVPALEDYCEWGTEV